ncbi:predicted protein [Naegleria gruberi]|uniref:Predicted protein n=1 Tax=Naegleria gruberi TaxID=5762 RepID=D2V4X1_NAEGR|nr:uncharacterized protein NAEGRDRAFT_46737 [Naegleria gruberi]EFC48178.1 predicted protein [Naegleria gruberi]|eukprot:XP_002680922.1 predicted protein [Naegleria gruberi strain NEG-M]
MNKPDDESDSLKEKKKDSIQYANKSFTEILANILRGSMRFFAQNYYLGFGLVLTLAIVYTLDVFNLRSESLLSERAKLEEHSEAGVRLLRIQDRRPFQRPTQQQLPPYYPHQPQLPNIYPPHHHVNNPYINRPPPPPRQSRYDESVLLNPNRTITDREVPSDEYLDRDTHRLHQDLYYHTNNQIPFHPVPFPFPQHQQVPYHPYHPYVPPPQPKLLNPDGKLKKKEKKSKNREKLLLDPFNPSHNIIQTEDLKKDQKKKQRLLYKRFDSKENSVADNISIQLLKSNFPQYNQKQILPTYVEESTVEESSIIDTSDKGVQIDLKTQEKPIQTKQTSPPVKIEPKKEEPKDCKDHLFDAFRHSGHLHSRIIDLETYFQILEKQEREGNDNSLLDIAILNNTNLFPEKPPQAASSQIPAFQADIPIHNVSNIPLFNSNEQKIPKSNEVHIVYELEDYMPTTLSNSLRKSVTISDKPTILTYSNTKIQPVQQSIANMPIHSVTEQSYPIQKESIAKELIPQLEKPVEPAIPKRIIEETPKKAEPKKPVEILPAKIETVVKSEPVIEDEEPKPPPFEERVIILGEEKKEEQPEETLHKPYVPPVYLDKIIYIDDLRKKDSPKQPESTIDMTPVEIPYYEERVIHIGREDPKEEDIHQVDYDDNISVSTIGSQETYQDYLQRIGIDIDNMPFSSEARKLIIAK